MLEPTGCEFPGCMADNEYFLEEISSDSTRAFYYCSTHAKVKKTFATIIYSIKTDRMVQEV